MSLFRPGGGSVPKVNFPWPARRNRATLVPSLREVEPREDSLQTPAAQREGDVRQSFPALRLRESPAEKQFESLISTSAVLVTPRMESRTASGRTKQRTRRDGKSTIHALHAQTESIFPPLCRLFSINK